MNAFVLTGGGSLGAVHVGMLRALYERDIAPDVIVGASVGAVNGAFIASRPATVQTASELGEVWNGLERSHVYPMNFVGGFLGFAGKRPHFVSNRGLRRLIDSHTQFQDLADARTPLKVIGTDATTGEEVLLDRGNAVDAVLASAAIPGVFPPVPWGDRLLIDGGVSNYAPISHALEYGADTVYVLTSGTACGLAEPPTGAIPMMLHAASFLVTSRLIVEMRHLSDTASFVVLPPPCPLRVAPHDFRQAATLAKASYESSAPFLDRLDPNVNPPLPLHLTRLGRHLRA